jgi:hypothetical protein
LSLRFITIIIIISMALFKDRLMRKPDHPVCIGNLHLA